MIDKTALLVPDKGGVAIWNKVGQNVRIKYKFIIIKNYKDIF